MSMTRSRCLGRPDYIIIAYIPLVTALKSAKYIISAGSLTGVKSIGCSPCMEVIRDCCPTPVPFLIQRRPELTETVLAAIRRAGPIHLLVAADRPEKDERCQQTRKLVLEGIDWPCVLQTRFSEKRLGCGQAISQALDWGFTVHERLIIIEDDCLPDPSFFRFCTELFERYQYEEKVMQICGSNLSGHKAQNSSSYYCSRFPTIWGWASWRRAWIQNDARMSAWPACRSSQSWRHSCSFAGEVGWRKHIYNSAHFGAIETWDTAWEFTKQVCCGVSLIPCVNLVSNLEFGAEATHTFDLNDPRSQMTIVSIDFPLRHVETIVTHDEADLSYFTEYCRAPSLVKRAINRLLRLLNKN